MDASQALLQWHVRVVVKSETAKILSQVNGTVVFMLLSTILWLLPFGAVEHPVVVAIWFSLN